MEQGIMAQKTYDNEETEYQLNDHNDDLIYEPEAEDIPPIDEGEESVDAGGSKMSSKLPKIKTSKKRIIIFIIIGLLFLLVFYKLYSIIFGSSQQLKKGVLLYSGTLPGQKGKTIILGHSAPVGWPDINYDNVFSNINQLEKGDEIFIFYNKKKYIYEVFAQKIFLPKNEEQALLIEDKNQSILILLTCWPPGKDYQRIGVLTKLIK